MATSIVYELRQKPAGRGWAAYSAADNPLSASHAQMLDRLFAEQIRLSDLPPALPWIGILRTSSGDWLVTWHRPDENRLPGLLISPTEWEVAKSDLPHFLTKYDESFWRSVGAPVPWPGTVGGSERFPMGNCVGYLPLALDYLRRFDHKNAALTGQASAWPGGKIRPAWLNLCPFDVTPEGPSDLSALLKTVAQGMAPGTATPRNPAATSVAPALDSTSRGSSTNTVPVSRIEKLEATLGRMETTVLALERALQNLQLAAPRGATPAAPSPGGFDRRGALVIVASAVVAAVVSFGVLRLGPIPGLVESANTAATSAQAAAATAGAQADAAKKAAETAAKDAATKATDAVQAEYKQRFKEDFDKLGAAKTAAEKKMGEQVGVVGSAAQASTERVEKETKTAIQTFTTAAKAATEDAIRSALNAIKAEVDKAEKAAAAAEAALKKPMETGPADGGGGSGAKSSGDKAASQTKETKDKRAKPTPPDSANKD